MSAFSYVAMRGKADLATMAPGVAAALVTTVAGLLVAIPSMFGYNWLVHNLRVLTIDLDNFAQELVSNMETEYLPEEEEEEGFKLQLGSS
jgi:biopolymer transport protein TolQ